RTSCRGPMSQTASAHLLQRGRKGENMRSTSRTCIALAVSLLFVSLEVRATNAPTNLAATAVSSSQINLSWTDNSTDEIGFTFMFDTNSAFTNPTYVWAGGANTTSYAHTGRGAATTYYYKIKAEGNCECNERP